MTTFLYSSGNVYEKEYLPCEVNNYEAVIKVIINLFIVHSSVVYIVLRRREEENGKLLTEVNKVNKRLYPCSTRLFLPNRRGCNG
jgi:hypothetical protein